MPIDLSTNAIIENNKLASDNVALLLLEITYPAETPIYVCLNNATVIWNGRTWLPAIFSLSGLSETKDAEIPSVTLSFIDINRAITPVIDEHGGGMGATVIMRVVNSKYLENTTPEIEETMEIIDCSIDYQNKISLRLGAENLINRRCPQNRYLKNHCRFEFKDARCGYSGSATECNRTFANCKILLNQTRFGGFPGVGNMGFMA